MVASCTDSPRSLAYWRRRRLLSQSELAERAGVGRSTIEKLEQGRYLAGVAAMRKLCRALQLDDPMEVTEFRRAIEGDGG